MPGGGPIGGGGAFRPDGLLERRAQLLRASDATCEVVTDVHHILRALLDAEHRIERGDPVRLRGRNGQSLADVVQPAFADPAHPGLERVQGGEQEVPLLPCRTSAS